MKRELFVDSSAWYAIVDMDDKNHISAKTFISQAIRLNTLFITSNCIIGETYTLIRTRLGYQEAWKFLKGIKSSSRLKIVFINEDMESEAYKLLQKYQDQDFSYVDGTSFVVMQERKILEAFSYDQHFLAAGFVKLPYS